MHDTIHWHRYFDRVFCIHYLPNTNKLPRLRGELARVGLLDSGIFEWRFTCPSKYDNLIFKAYKEKDLAPNVGFVNLCLEIRRIPYESKAFGYERILLLENDVAFLKDLAELKRLLEAAPKGYFCKR